jgi:hypothetical protein
MDINHTQGAGQNHGVEYDKTDLGAKGFLIFFLVLGIFAVAMHLGALALYAGMTKFAEAHEAETSPLAPQTYTPRAEILTNTANVNTKQFPQPRLEPHLHGTPGLMTKFLREETKTLTAPPWQDKNGNVHLPIDMAMRDVLSRLPVRPGGVEIPNYPGAARKYSYPSVGLNDAGAPDSGAQGNGAANGSAAGMGGISAAGK